MQVVQGLVRVQVVQGLVRVQVVQGLVQVQVLTQGLVQVQVLPIQALECAYRYTQTPVSGRVVRVPVPEQEQVPTHTPRCQSLLSVVLGRYWRTPPVGYPFHLHSPTLSRHATPAYSLPYSPAEDESGEYTVRRIPPCSQTTTQQ